MKSIFYILALILFLSCNQSVLKINKAKNISDNTVCCDTTDFDLYNYFSKERITRYKNEIKRFERRDDKEFPADSGIVVVGSSSVRSWYNLESFFEPLPVIKRGFGGSTFPELIYYSNELIFKYNPLIVVVYEGDNDQYILSPYEIFECACFLERKIHEFNPEIDLFFISAKPCPSRSEKIRSTKFTNDYLKKIAKNSENTYYIDVWSGMFDENLQMKRDIYKKDNLHLNDKGYKIWNEIVYPIIKQAYDSKIQ